MGLIIYTIYKNCDPLTANYILNINDIVPYFINDQFKIIPGFMGILMAVLFNGVVRLFILPMSSLRTSHLRNI